MAGSIDRTAIQRYAVAIGLTALAMAWLAPLESSVWMTPVDRYIFWFTTVTAGWLQMIIIAHGVRAAFGTERFPGWVLLLVAAAVGAVPITFEVRYLWGILKNAPTMPTPYWYSYLTVLFINVNFSLLQWWLVERWPLTRHGDRRASNTPAGPPRPDVVMLRRRPDNLTGTIACLEMEDHYLRVHTDQGEGLVLHRMADAVDDLKATDGMQVHRSWWVARHAVARSLTKNRRRFLELTDGRQIPVGRSFQPKLKEAGWF